MNIEFAIMAIQISTYFIILHNYLFHDNLKLYIYVIYNFIATFRSKPFRSFLFRNVEEKKHK